MFTPVDLPAFGDHVFYAQQHLNDDPSEIYRQRIYSVRADYDRNAIRLTIHIPDDPERLIDAHLEPDKLAELQPAETTILPGCDVFWQRRANQFLGFMELNACSYVSRKTGERMIFNDDLLLTDKALWITDRAHDEAGKLLMGHPTGVPHKNLKARRLECWTTGRQ